MESIMAFKWGPNIKSVSTVMCLSTLVQELDNISRQVKEGARECGFMPNQASPDQNWYLTDSKRCEQRQMEGPGEASLS